MILAAAHADVVIGSRYCRGGSTQGWSSWRKYLSAFANRYCAYITGMPIHDATAGFNLIKADILRDATVAQLNLSGYAFQMELKYLLWKHGARFTEIPIIFKERREGESKISSHIIIEGVIAPWKLRFKKQK
jgi:dolichol-phosphate mannosyltransferase